MVQSSPKRALTQAGFQIGRVRAPGVARTLALCGSRGSPQRCVTGHAYSAPVTFVARLCIANCPFAREESPFIDSEIGRCDRTGILVSGKAQPSADQPEYLYRGIAGRDFERRFPLADHVKVVGASLDKGPSS